MNNFFIRLAIMGGFFSATSACTAGNYDLPACLDSEVCGNGLDDDCDGIKDNPEFCKCTKIDDRRPCPARLDIVTNKTNPASICTDEDQICLPNLQWSSCKGVDPTIEKCGNGRDDDCDGGVDAQDPEGCVNCIDGETQSLTIPELTYGPNSLCKPEVQECKNGTWMTRPGANAVAPKSADATCDGVDDDCDGNIDEDAKWGNFPLGAPCWDSTQKGVCRTVGTVACNNGSSTCYRSPRTADSSYRIAAASNVQADSSAPNAPWDWNCDGMIESIYCTGMNPTCTTSSANYIGKTIYITLDQTADCSIVRYFSGLMFPCNAVIIKPKLANGFIQCGSSVTITECTIPLVGFSCNDKGAPQDGFLYCR